MSRVNIAGYDVSANPKAPNSLFNSGDGSPDAITDINIQETDTEYIFTAETASGTTEEIGRIAKTAGAAGVTFTPHLQATAAGVVLSWTNDGGLENPDPVTIENGATGPAGPTGATGATGPAGAPGADGVSPRVTATANTVSKTLTITITDADGTRETVINYGADVTLNVGGAAGVLEGIAENANRSRLVLTGTNGTRYELPVIFVGSYADPGNNLLNGLEIGSDHGAGGEKNEYILIRSESGLSYLYTLPGQGTAGQVLGKLTGASFDYGWIDPGNVKISIEDNGAAIAGNFNRIAVGYGGGNVVRFITDGGAFAAFGIVPRGGAAGAVLTKDSADDYDYTWQVPTKSAFIVEEVTDISQANMAAADIRITSTGNQNLTFTRGWRANFTASPIFTSNSAESPLVLQTNLLDSAIPAGGTRRRYTDFTLWRNSGKCFAFDLGARLGSMTPGAETAQGVYTKENMMLYYLVGAQTGGYTTGFFIAGANGRLAAISEGDADVTPWGVTVSNVKYYKITEV